MLPREHPSPLPPKPDRAHTFDLLTSPSVNREPRVLSSESTSASPRDDHVRSGSMGSIGVVVGIVVGISLWAW